MVEQGASRPVVAGLVPFLVTAVLLVAGCGSDSHPRADVPPAEPSHFTFDRELTEAGVSSQMVQSLSETAQSAAYDRDEFALTSSRADPDRPCDRHQPSGSGRPSS